MIVKELIKELLDCDLEKQIVVCTSENVFECIDNIRFSSIIGKLIINTEIKE